VRRGVQCVNRWPGCSAFRVKSARTCFNLVLVDWPRALESFPFVSQNVAPGHFWFRRVWQALAVFSRGPKGARPRADPVRARRGHRPHVGFLGSDLAGHQGSRRTLGRPRSAISNERRRHPASRPGTGGLPPGRLGREGVEGRERQEGLEGLDGQEGGFRLKRKINAGGSLHLKGGSHTSNRSSALPTTRQWAIDLRR
jgi:hypothetical protein